MDATTSSAAKTYQFIADIEVRKTSKSDMLIHDSVILNWINRIMNIM